MSDEHSKDQPSTDDCENPSKERARISEMAATTLCKLRGLMKQMRDWREDRANLRRDVWRLRTALRAAGEEAAESLQADPLIEHQSEEIRRLRSANEALRREISDIKTVLEESAARNAGWRLNGATPEQEFLVEREVLNNEIARLRTRLADAETGHEGAALENLRSKLKEFLLCDRAVEMLFTDVIGRVAETVSNLAEELVNTTEQLQSTKSENARLQPQVDRLNAMLRSSGASSADYQKRVNELGNLAERLKNEVDRFQAGVEDASSCEALESTDALVRLERLADNLKGKLRNDREAFLAAGDPDRLKYMKKLIDLRINVRRWCLNLERSKEKNGKKNGGWSEYLRKVSGLRDSLKQIDIEIGRLKSERVLRHCRTSGIEGSRYLRKLEELEVIVNKTKIMITAMKEEQRAEGASNGRTVERFGDLIRKLAHEMKELEVIVVSNDSSSLFKRIEQLEESLVRLKARLTEGDERASALGEEFSKTRGALEQKSKELKDTLNRVVALREDNQSLRERAKSVEEKASELARERDAQGRKLEEMQRTKREVDAYKKQLESLHRDKESLSGKVEALSNLLTERNERFENILAEKATLETSLNTQMFELKAELRGALEENEKLRSEIAEAKGTGRSEAARKSARSADDGGDTRHSEESAQHLSVLELQRLKGQLDESERNCESARRSVVELKVRMGHLADERAKLEANVLRLDSQKELLACQLNAERAASAERLKGFAKLMSEYNELENERACLRSENEALKVELTELRGEKESLKKSAVDASDKYLALENQVSKYEAERDALREELSNFRASSERLTGALRKTETELDEATGTIKRLELENSRFNDNSDALTLKNTAVEARVQVLLTEKNDLATRINELNEGNGALSDQLNKVKAENEYFTIELNKSRMENDKAASRNALLQYTLGEMKGTNALLEVTNNELAMKLNELQGENRKLERRANAALRKKKESLVREDDSSRNCVDKLSLSSKTSKKKKREPPTARSATTERPVSDVNRSIEIEGDRPREDDLDDAKRAMVAEKCTEHNDKVKIADRTKGELKRLSVENEALKFEMMNLRTENSQVRLELSRTRDEFERLRIRLARTEADEGTIRPISNKLEIVNLYYRQEVNRYLPCYPNGNADALKNWRSDCTSEIDQLAGNDARHRRNELDSDRESAVEARRLIQMIDKLTIDNVALRIEVDQLRCNIIANFAREERARNELRYDVDEIQALRVELTKLRDEKESLWVRLGSATTELDKLEAEKLALKDELITLRKTNYRIRNKTDELRAECHILKGMNAELEGCLSDALRQINKYTISSGCPNKLEDQLKNLLKKCTLAKPMPAEAGNEQIRNSNETSAETLATRPDEMNYQCILAEASKA